MSIWTHVAGTARFDGLAFAILGLNWEEEKKIIHDAFMPDLPEGSEGPVQFEIVKTGYDDHGSGSLNRASIVIWGDLRDFEEPQKVIKWFVASLRRLGKPSNLPAMMTVRSAVLITGREYAGIKHLCYWSGEALEITEVPAPTG